MSIHPIDIAAANNKISYAAVLVTPDMAKRWLDDNNSNNRNIRKAKVAEYAADMVAGRWEFNGETIQFDRGGMLLNGQHRLLAIVETGLSQTFLIVRGLDTSVQTTMDQGSRRTPQDQLQINGILTDSSVAAAIRVYITWTNGKLFGDQIRVKINTTEIVAWAEDNHELVCLLQDLAWVKKAPNTTPSVALAIALRLSLIDEMDCVQFFTQLITLDGIKGAVSALRNRLDRAGGVANGRRTPQERLTSRDIIGYYVLAWNAYRENRPIRKLQRPKESKGHYWTPENFPVPR